MALTAQELASLNVHQECMTAVMVSARHVVKNAGPVLVQQTTANHVRWTHLYPPYWEINAFNSVRLIMALMVEFALLAHLPVKPAILVQIYARAVTGKMDCFLA